MRTQQFGIEIEMTGITRAAAAATIADYFGTRAAHIGGLYDTYTVRDAQGRQWKIVNDSSIKSEIRHGAEGGSSYKVEFVSPICLYEDIGTIQELVRNLRQNGAIVNNSCGIHVHVNALPHSVKTLRNIVNIIAAKEELLYKALQVNVNREHFCKRIDTAFLSELNNRRPLTMGGLERIWYHGDSRSYHHYDDTRYHALNLHSVFSKGTIEFRLFNSTLHAGKVKTYIQLCLAISHQALIQKTASRLRTNSTNEKYTFRTWLLRLGMIGDEFKTARKLLLESLEGNIAWHDPEQAAAQKIRLAEKREAKRRIAISADNIIPAIEENAASDILTM